MLSSLKMLFSLMITLLFFGILFTTLVSDVRPSPPPVPLPPALKVPSPPKGCKGCSDVRPSPPPVPLPPALKVPSPPKGCKGCSDVRPSPPPVPLPPALKVPSPPKGCKGCRGSLIEKVMARYFQTWKKEQENSTKFRDLLRSTCHGFTKAVVSQDNTPVGAQIVYDGEKRKPLSVTAIFNTFAKRNPFSNKTWDTCSVVGNGGILSNSTCGEMIDSAQFVIRFRGLQERRRPFMESMRRYNDSLMLLPAFSYSTNTAVSLRALYTIEDFESPIRPVFLNPEYLQNLHSFWRSKGLNKRLSSGLMVASLALELCTNVHLYGFWPFDQHPLSHQPLNNHYYDNVPSKKNVHAMPAEFDHLLRLHEQGVLKIHLGECRPSSR
ncbi:alpha-2,8-sialyltransferase 8F-like isoform X2 [Gadus macrocephalus]|uniref:alpha-2,8-sialyltransferase 8F-like isoform X2 n=1 Tax=Gadus macrocephalus TaxID=80720 RepID=UPI0028CB9ADF|nr:alpha-2,8-sialyltransferase 8F-like isoform X2 [Gadus macrocephalus]